MTALSELLRQANAEREKLSARQIALAAQERGFSLNHDTAARYLRGDHGRPKEATLVALSEVLHVPLGKLRTAATLPADVTEPYRPPAEASRLNRRQRRAVDEIIRAMLGPAEVGEQTAAAAMPTDSGAGTPVTHLDTRRPAKTGKAARRGPVEPPQR
jgi:transcriptional regulator with XRE-family HTH domain